jgi:two-component system sensor histidine kinase QseC
MNSIRRRTLLLVLGLLGLTLSFISYWSYSDARHEVEEVFDAELLQTARLVAGLVGRDMTVAEREALQATLDQAIGGQDTMGQAGIDAHQYEGKLGLLVMDAQGAALLHSASSPVSALDQLPLAQFRGAVPSVSDTGAAVPALAGVAAGFHDAELNQHAWRLFLLHDRADALWILVGERADVRGELAEKIALRSLVPDLLGLPLVALLVWLAVGWGLSPLERMVRLLKSRAPDSLSPLVVGPVPVELEAMVASINRLMVQANELLARERRFLAYAAHELRTPLTVLRIQAHNAAHAPDATDRGEALKQLDNSVLRATRVVEQLLTLARLEPGAAELDLQPINMLVRVREQLAELTPLALGRHQELTLETSGQDGWQLLVDAHCLDVLLQNLVSNAVQHTPEGGQVVVCLQAEPDALTLCVQDSGPGVPAAQRGQVFEPFFRQGPAQGAGLGLAIVARIVDLHAARISLGDSPQGGLQVCVRWPRGGAVAP